MHIPDPQDLEHIEHIKSMAVELKRIDKERKNLIKEMYSSVMSLDHRYRFDLIKDTCGSYTQKYIVEACKEHVPELMKEAEL